MRLSFRIIIWIFHTYTHIGASLRLLSSFCICTGFYRTSDSTSIWCQRCEKGYYSRSFCQTECDICPEDFYCPVRNVVSHNWNNLLIRQYVRPNISVGAYFSCCSVPLANIDVPRTPYVAKDLSALGHAATSGNYALIITALNFVFGLLSCIL